MDFELTRENLMIRDAIRNWVSKECNRDVVGELDADWAFPGKLSKKLAKLGFSGITVPEEFDGEGKNILGSCLVVEEIAYAYPALAAIFAASAFNGGAVIAELGSQQQKENHLPGISRGTFLVALAIVDEDSRADIPAVKALKSDDDFVLSGKASNVHLADQSKLMIISAQTGTEVGETTLFCLDIAQDGISIEPRKNLGYRGAGFCDVNLTNVHVHQDQILGGKAGLNRGVEQEKQIVSYQLLANAAAAVGIARGALDYAIDHARQRVQFSQKIGSFPAIGHKMAEIAYRCEAAQFMVYKAAWQADQGQDFSRAAAGAKCLAAESAVNSAKEGLQILGGYGYTMEYDIQRYLRDSMASLFVGKTLDALKDQISVSLGL